MKVVYFLTRQKRSLAASLIVFSTQHVTFRLVWALTHYKQVCVCVWLTLQPFGCNVRQPLVCLNADAEMNNIKTAFSLSDWQRRYYQHRPHFSSQPHHVSFFFQVRQAVTEGNCCFGTIDTWLLFKLTKGVLCSCECPLHEYYFF